MILAASYFETAIGMASYALYFKRHLHTVSICTKLGWYSYFFTHFISYKIPNFNIFYLLLMLTNKNYGVLFTYCNTNRVLRCLAFNVRVFRTFKQKISLVLNFSLGRHFWPFLATSYGQNAIVKASCVSNL